MVVHFFTSSSDKTGRGGAGGRSEVALLFFFFLGEGAVEVEAVAILRLLGSCFRGGIVAVKPFFAGGKAVVRVLLMPRVVTIVAGVEVLYEQVIEVGVVGRRGGSSQPPPAVSSLAADSAQRLLDILVAW